MSQAKGPETNTGMNLPLNFYRLYAWSIDVISHFNLQAEQKSELNQSALGAYLMHVTSAINDQTRDLFPCKQIL